jgi:SnoaL-like domain
LEQTGARPVRFGRASVGASRSTEDVWLREENRMVTPQNERLREQRENVVRRHIAAENTGDLDGMIASFHRPRYQVIPMGGITDGEAVRGLVAGLLAAFSGFHFEPQVIHHADNPVVVEARMTGTHRAEWAGLKPFGHRMDIRVACVFDFEGVVNESVYFDLATLQRQLASG